MIECIYEYSQQHFTKNKIAILNFAQWIEVNFGRGIARHFMTPYNQKLYRSSLEELSPESGGRFVPKSDLKMLLRGALCEGQGGLGYNATFFYPEKEGIELLVKKLSENIRINVGECVQKIDISNHTVTTSDGKVYGYDFIISSMPLNLLVKSIEGQIDKIRDLAAKLKYVSVLNVNIGLSAKEGSMHWVYVPEERYLFHRLGFIHNFSDATHRQDAVQFTLRFHTGLMMELIKVLWWRSVYRMHVPWEYWISIKLKQLMFWIFVWYMSF